MGCPAREPEASGIYGAKKSHHQPGATARDSESYYPKATREQFKNHPTHNHEIDPTIGGYCVVCERGHPWGVLGLLCARGTLLLIETSFREIWIQARTETKRPGVLETARRITRHFC